MKTNLGNSRTMGTSKPNTGQIYDHDANISNLSLIVGDIVEDDLSLQGSNDNSNETFENNNRIIGHTAASQGGGKDQGECNENSKGKEDDVIEVAGAVASCHARLLDLSLRNMEETIMTGADAASLETKCDEGKKQEDNAEDLKATPSNFIKETTMDGVQKVFLEANCDNDKKQEEDAKALLMLENHAHSLDVLMGNIEETTMAGVDIASLEEKCDDVKEQEDNAKALLLLESGSPLSKKKSSKILGKVENFPSDCYSFLSLHGPIGNPLFFSFGMMVYIFQITFLLLMVFSVLHEKWHENGEGDNPGKGIVASFIPTNASPLVQGTQFLAILAFIVFADASILDIARSVETFPTHSTEATKCMVFSCVLRFSQGMLAMLVTLLLIITSKSVIEIVLNFAAVVSSLVHF